MANHTYDQQVLLDVEDGPEGIKIYLSMDRGVVDWSSSLPAMYIEATLWGASVKLGPFHMNSVRDAVVHALGKSYEGALDRKKEE